MKLIQELATISKGEFQADLKSSDGSDAGSKDVSSKPVDVQFSMMRNVLNSDGKMSGSDINDYLERAAEINDQVDTVAFGIEDGEEIIKVYVNATQADEFEAEMSKLLGMEDDAEAAINTLAQKFDIVDVVWPSDPEGDADDLTIDSDFDELFGDEETEPALAADDEPAAPTDEPDAADTPAASTDEPTAGEVEADLAAGADEEPAADDSDDSASDDSASDEDDEEAEEDEVELDDEGNPKKDADGNVIKKKKKKVQTEEGLDQLAKLAKSGEGKFVLEAIAEGRVLGYMPGMFVSREAAELMAEQKSTDEIKFRVQGVDMTIGANFLSRVLEAKDAPVDRDSVKDGKAIPMDKQYSALAAQLPRAIDKKLVAFYAMTGIPGRFVNVDGVKETIQAAGDMLRKERAVLTAFNKFYNLLADVKGFALEAAERPVPKRGAAIQKMFETILIRLGLPEEVVSTEGPGPAAPALLRVAKLIASNDELKRAMIMLAQRMGIRTDDVNQPVMAGQERHGKVISENDGNLNVGADPYLNMVQELFKALGLPENHLDFQEATLVKALREKRAKLKNRAMVMSKMKLLLSVLRDEEEPNRTFTRVAKEGLNEAFGELEALTDRDLEHLNMLEPAAGPAMMALHVGDDKHEETILAVGVDPDATGMKTLRVGIDGPFDGSLHARYFENSKEGYKAALDYANLLRTTRLKTGGRPKGWN